MKKLDVSMLVGVSGLVIATTGLAMFSIPLALVCLGSFLVWITEKANRWEFQSAFAFKARSDRI